MYSVSEALAAEQVAAREMIVSYPHPGFGTMRTVGCPIKMPGVAPRYGAASALGADTEAVPGAFLHLTVAEVNALRAQGAV